MHLHAPRVGPRLGTLTSYHRPERCRMYLQNPREANRKTWAAGRASRMLMETYGSGPKLNMEDRIGTSS